MSFINEIIAQQGFALADGAIGTNLFSKGLETGDAPELWNLTAPEKITELLEEFVAAGADILLTNSFGGTRYRMKLHQAETQIEEINVQAAKLARKVADRHDKKIVIAGSIGPTGELFAPLGTMDKTSAIDAFTEQASALAKGGVDVLWIETMSSLEEAEAAIIAAQTTGLPVYITMTFDTAGRTMMGVPPQAFATAMQHSSISGFGANCGIGPAELLDSVFGFVEARPDQPVIIAKGNCGIPHYVEGAIHYHGTPELMADYARMAYQAGARIIGGCCGTSPAHLAAMRQALDEVAQPAVPVTRDEAAALLGVPWKDVPKAPEEGRNSRKKRRRNR